jgi:hypothetical protein
MGDEPIGPVDRQWISPSQKFIFRESSIEIDAPRICVDEMTRARLL